MHLDIRDGCVFARLPLDGRDQGDLGLECEDSGSGVVTVTALRPGSNAERFGLAVPCQLLWAGSTEVSSVAVFKRAVAAAHLAGDQAVMVQTLLLPGSQIPEVSPSPRRSGRTSTAHSSPQRQVAEPYTVFVSLAGPLGLTFARRVDGPIHIDTVEGGGAADRAGVRPPCIVLSAGEVRRPTSGGDLKTAVDAARLRGDGEIALVLQPVVAGMDIDDSSVPLPPPPLPPSPAPSTPTRPRSPRRMSRVPSQQHQRQQQHRRRLSQPVSDVSLSGPRRLSTSSFPSPAPESPVRGVSTTTLQTQEGLDGSFQSDQSLQARIRRRLPPPRQASLPAPAVRMPPRRRLASMAASPRQAGVDRVPSRLSTITPPRRVESLDVGNWPGSSPSEMTLAHTQSSRTIGAAPTPQKTEPELADRLSGVPDISVSSLVI
eukprot:TRINITY_DN16744_c0_g1_i1.p1 TRINITY_DN16744_c0_g1~~TRINITY_DN16744_c0_g1_i1.p1  ORF type:complete len:472 (+),score=56.26 TRINITY_DN16744_c0_g1_i1:127-1416(+)